LLQRVRAIAHDVPLRLKLQPTLFEHRLACERRGVVVRQIQRGNSQVDIVGAWRHLL
jgi:hypothetical protein